MSEAIAASQGDNARTRFDLARVRAEFPALDQTVNGYPLAYLDNAATSHKPESVIEAIADYYRHDNSNVHRAAHAVAGRATQRFEAVREKTARFINAPASHQVLWTRGTTEAINLVAWSWGRSELSAGDRILVPVMEHHSNIVPWQLVAEATGAQVESVAIDERGALDLDALRAQLDERVKMVAVAHVSNALGTINPVAEIVRMAHEAGACVLVDGAQAVNHWPMDVQALDCDFYTFSGHKMFGPNGIGVLYGREALLEAMPPYQGGGEMIDTVSFSGTTYGPLPYKFEAGTPNVAGVIGLGEAIDYLDGLDRDGAAAHEEALLTEAERLAGSMEGLRLIGTAEHKTGVMSFLLDGTHPADLGMLLDEQGVAVRTGHHCAQPLMEHFGISGTVRASFSFYNSFDEVQRLFAALEKARKLLV